MNSAVILSHSRNEIRLESVGTKALSQRSDLPSVCLLDKGGTMTSKNALLGIACSKVYMKHRLSLCTRFFSKPKMKAQLCTASLSTEHQMAHPQILPLNDEWFDIVVRKRLETLLRISRDLDGDLRRSIQQVMDGVAKLSLPVCFRLRAHLVRHVHSFYLTKSTNTTSGHVLITFSFDEETFHSCEAKMNARWPIQPGFMRHTYTHLVSLFPEFISWLPEFKILSTPEDLYVEYRTEEFMSGMIQHMERPVASPAAIAALPRVPVTRAMLGENGKAGCSICLQDVEGNEVTMLPCKHFFITIASALIWANTVHCVHCAANVLLKSRSTKGMKGPQLCKTRLPGSERWVHMNGHLVSSLLPCICDLGYYSNRRVDTLLTCPSLVPQSVVPHDHGLEKIKEARSQMRLK